MEMPLSNLLIPYAKMKERFDLYRIEPGESVQIPYIDDGIPAGFPSPAQDYIRDTIDLNETLILTPGKTYFARINSYYLPEEELEKGDGIIIDTTLRPINGDLALCVIDGDRMLKYIERKRGVFLVAGATEERVEICEENSAYILGIVTTILKVRRYKGRRTLIYQPRKEPDGKQLTKPKRAIRWGYVPEYKYDVKGVVDLNEEFIHNPLSTSFGKVAGFSLLEDDIQDNDSVIIDSSLEPNNGDLAVSFTEDGFTLKYVKHDESGLWLLPGNGSYTPILITEDNELLIWGIITVSVRQLRQKGRRKK